MKILHTVQLYSPAIGGSEEVIKQLSERLAKRGHDVTVATTVNKQRTSKEINGVKIKEFEIYGNDIYGMRGEKGKYQNFLESEKFDIILNYGTQIWSTDLMLHLLPILKAKKVLVPVGYQGLKNPVYKKYYQTLAEKLPAYDKIIYLSKHYQDKKFGDELGLKNGIVIGNAANEDEFLLSTDEDFRKKYQIKTPYFLLTVANHYPAKGHWFVIDAFKKLNRKDVTLVIIGEKPVNFGIFFFNTCYYKCKLKSLLHKNIRLVSKISRADTVAAFKAADLFVFGSQMECSPLVIFESMAAKTPFISTDCGNVKDFDKYGSIIKSSDEMAIKISEWLEEPTKMKKIGEAAFKNWQAHYTWEHITDEYENLYKSLLEK